MLKTLKVALICCPLGFSEEMSAVFQMKQAQIDSENDKNPKIFQFAKISCIFPKFLTDFVDWNVEKGQQGKNVLSTRLFRTVYCSFLCENISN